MCLRGAHEKGGKIIGPVDVELEGREFNDLRRDAARRRSRLMPAKTVLPEMAGNRIGRGQGKGVRSAIGAGRRERDRGRRAVRRYDRFNVSR